jgi:hypothetical protein
MLLPDLSELQSGCAFHVESCVSGDKVHTLGDTVDDYYDCVIAMHLRELDNDVDANDVASVCWSLCRVELSIWSMVLQLSLVA